MSVTRRKEPMFAKMVIGECLSETQLREFAKVYENDVTPQLGKEPGYLGSQLLEEGGCMVIALTKWTTREDCLRYHSSRNYRQFVAGTQHLLAGSFVVKIFKEER
jgi:heme-degrading monooxygenase HmoA